jgi:hypothetical protein
MPEKLSEAGPHTSDLSFEERPDQSLVTDFRITNIIKKVTIVLGSTADATMIDARRLHQAIEIAPSRACSAYAACKPIEVKKRRRMSGVRSE